MLDDPGMALNLLKSESLLGVQSQNVLDEMADFLREVVGELEINGPDALIGLVVVWCFEGREAATELVAQDAKTPNVDALVVRLLHHHLWWKVVEGAAEGLPLISRRVDAPAKIGDLDCPLDITQVFEAYQTI